MNIFNLFKELYIYITYYCFGVAQTHSNVAPYLFTQIINTFLEKNRQKKKFIDAGY